MEEDGNLDRRFVRRPSAIFGGYGIGILIAAYRTVNHCE
jgi:hypothetical protein